MSCPACRAIGARSPSSSGTSMSNCQPANTSVHPWASRWPSPTGGWRGWGKGGVLSSCRYADAVGPPRFDTSTRAQPLRAAGSAGCTTTTSWSKWTSPSAPRSARSRSTIAALAGGRGIHRVRRVAAGASSPAPAAPNDRPSRVRYRRLREHPHDGHGGTITSPADRATAGPGKRTEGDPPAVRCQAARLRQAGHPRGIAARRCWPRSSATTRSGRATTSPGPTRPRSSPATPTPRTTRRSCRPARPGSTASAR